MFDEAIEDLQIAKQADPRDPFVLYRLGLTYYEANEYKKATAALKECLKMREESDGTKNESADMSDIYYHIGLSYANLGKYEKSIFPFSEGTKIHPNEIRFIHERAKAFQAIGKHEEAIKDFSAVIERNPGNAHAYFRRAFAYKALGLYDFASADFESAKRMDP